MILLDFLMELETPEDRKESRFVIHMAAQIGKSREYTWRLLRKEPHDLDFVDAIGTPWNDYSRQRFHRLLQEHPDRSNILVSAGCNHLPVFE